MGFKRLDIARLGEDGEVRRTITCLGGRVSVFRSRSPRELGIYTSALRGEPIEERFSVLLDGGEFKASNHTFIGFGEDIFKNSTMRVTEFLSSCGAPWSAVDALLLDFGLGGLSGVPCHGLSAIQQNILRLIGTWFGKDKVIVLNDPFAGITNQLRERIAAKFADNAWENEQLIIITELKNRPECWLENPYIARIPLEAPRNATIGFGGSGGISTDFVATIRSQLKKVDAEMAATSGTPPEISQDAPPPPKRKPKVGTLTNPSPTRTITIPTFPFKLSAKEGALAAVLVLALMITFQSARVHFFSAQSTPPEVPAPIQTAEGTSPLPVVPPAQQVVPIPPAVPLIDTEPPVPAQPKAAPNVLEAYPEPIKLAVLKAFEQPLSVNVSAKASPNTPAPKIMQAQPSTFVPESSDQPDESTEVRFGAPPITSSDVQNEEELEARRAQLRQSFLEAVERSRALQNPMSDFPGDGGEEQ